MTHDEEYYWNIAGFLNDKEVHAIWDIIDMLLIAKDLGVWQTMANCLSASSMTI